MKRILLLALATLAPLAPAQTPLPTPTGASFLKGAKFTVAGYTNANGTARSTALAGFPVLVRLAADSPVGFSYADLSSATGDDLCFIDMDGNGLPFEIDTWDASDESLVWVRLPTVTNGAEFVMCWGGGTSGNTVCNESPFSGYVGVWHMSEASGTVADSSGHSLDAVPTGTGAATLSVAVSGPVGNGRQCSDGISTRSYLKVPSYNSQNVGNTFAISGWFNVSSSQSAQDARLVSRKANWEDNNGWELIWKKDTTIAARGASKDNITSAKRAFGTWKHLFVVYNGRTATIYENGGSMASATAGAAATDNDLALGIGDYPADVNQSPLVGSVDECRLLDALPGADWAWAEYASMADTAFLSAGEAQSYGGTVLPAVGILVTDRQYTNVSFTVSVGSIGTGAESADVSAMFAATDDFASPFWTTNYTVSGADAQTVSLVGLATGTTYYVQAQIANDQNVTNTSSVVQITTLAPGAPAGTATFVDRGFTTMSASATATSFGTGAESATMFLQASKTADFATVVSGAGVAAVLGESATLSVAGLEPGTNYSLRVCISNDWGVRTFVELPSARAREVPFATTGIGWTFAPDGSTVDVTFGVSGIYDGAAGTAELFFGPAPDATTSRGGKSVLGPGTLSWLGLSVTADPMYARVVLSATLDGQTYSETFSVRIAAGSTAVGVSDFAEHQSAETSVRVRVGDVVTLPELAGTDFYYLGNNRFGSLEGNVLTATEPGILGVFRVTDAGATTNTLPVVVLPEKIGSGDIYILKDNSIGNGWGYWDEAAKWEKVGSDTNDSWPHNPNDIAILGYWKNTGSISFEPRSGDVSLGALYIGNFRNAEAKLIFRYRNRVVFSRADGKPALIQFCANDRLTAKGATLSFQDSIAGVEFPCGVVVDGGWDGVENRCPRAYFEFKAPSFLLPEGKTLLLQNFSPSRDGEGTSFEKPFTGGGLVWNRSAANFNWTGDSLAGFTGTLRDSSHGASSFGYQAPLFVRSPGSNTVAEVIGFVSANTDANPQTSSASVGILQTGFNQNYRDANIHSSPWFTGRGLLLHGGTYHANANERVWGYGKADKKIGDVLTLSGGLNFLNRSWSRDQLKGQPINWVEFKSVAHEDKSSLVLWGDFWSNGAVSSADTTITISGTSTTETIPAGSVKTNHVMILSGIPSHAVGPDGDPRTTALHPVVPWMLAPVNNSGNGWNALGFAAFDENGWLVIPLRAEVTSLTADAAVPGANVAIHDRNIEISADVTVNSLLVNNQNKGKTLGEGRTLTVTSGGLILHGAGAIGTESGGAANGFLVLGDAEHPAYVWARGKVASPNQIWAPVTAPGGFVSAYTGNLVLGGDQTGIGDEIAVNAGSLALGTASTPCTLSADLPIRIFAGATLKLPNASSTEGTVLRFDGSAGWFGKIELGSGVAARCKKAYWRDFPETEEWQSLPRGVYGSSEAAGDVDYVRDDLFSGAGTLEVLADEVSVPEVANLSLVTCDDASATIAFDLWPGHGAESVEVFALVPGAGEGEVSTNRIYSSDSPDNGRYEGTLSNLVAETTYTVRLLAVNDGGFAAESPDALSFTTESYDETPLVELYDASSVGPGGATFPWKLVRAGSGHPIESIRLYWAESEAAFGDLASCTNVAVPAADFLPGNHETELCGLRPETSYFALLVAVNDGANASTSGPVAFATAAENSPGARPLELGSLYRTSAGLTAVVSAPAGEPAFQDVYAVWGARYEGESLLSWSDYRSVGSMGTEASSVSASLDAADLGDAVYVRFVGVPAEGRPSWSASVYLPDVAVAQEALPNVVPGSVETGANDATISAWVLDAGSGSGNGRVDVFLEWTFDPDAFAEGTANAIRRVPFTNGVPVGFVDPVRVGNLRAGRRYYARFLATNDVGQADAGAVFSFDTDVRDGVSIGSADYGLKQVVSKIPNSGGASADDLEQLAWDETAADVVEGAIMAYRYNKDNNGQNPYESERAGKSFVWKNNTAFLYRGWIFLEGGAEYTFGFSLDDACILRIDGAEVLRQPAFADRGICAAYVPPETGWHEIDVRLGNGSGGAGACGDDNTFGLGWNTNGVRTVSSNAMDRLLDGGDGSFLRPYEDRVLTVVSLTPGTGGVDAVVSLSTGLPAGTLRAYWGASDAGTDKTAWTGHHDFRAVSSGEETVSGTIDVADPAATPFVRFVVDGGNGVELWSPLLSLDFSQPQIGAVAVPTDGDRMTVTGSLLSAGSGAGLSLSLVYGYEEDLSDAAVTNIPVAGAGPFSATVPVLPGTNGWWRLVATTTDGGYDATLPATFATAAGSVLDPDAAATVVHHDLAASGWLDVLGAGTTTVTLWAGDDPESLAPVSGASTNPVAVGPVSVTGTIPGNVPHTVWWKLVAVNVAPGGTTWTNETSVFTTETVDAATYTWNPVISEGNWDDPANWIVSGGYDDVLGFPSNAVSKVVFVTNTAATIAVRGAYPFQSTDFRVKGLDLTFSGTNAAVCRLEGDIVAYSNPQNDTTVISGTRVVLSGVTLRDSNAAFNWATKRSEDCTLRLENGSVLSVDGWMHVFGTNTWIEVVEGSRFDWRTPISTSAGFDLCNYGGGVRLEDGTMNPPHLVPQRYVGTAGPDQSVEIAGDSRLQCGVAFRTYNNNDDKMLNDVDFVFSIPLDDWLEPADAPVYADYERGTAENKKFAYRSPVGEGKIVLSVDLHSPLVQSGRARTVRLLAWKAGIDTNNVELVDGVAPSGQTYADLYYTYGWPSTAKTPENAGDAPTGVAADATGIGGMLLILR